MGPFLIKEKMKLLVRNGKGIENFQNILKQLERAANSEETKAKRAEVEAKMKMIGRFYHE